MPLFQKPASTPEEIERSQPLALTPEEVADLDEASWYARAYRGDDVPQLTLRAVLTGSVLGFVLAFTNTYSSLKTGWAMPVTLIACTVSFVSWGTLAKIGFARRPMSILETNCMQSTATSAGVSTGSITSASIPALLLLSVTTDHPGGRQLPWPLLAGWILSAAVLGVALAIPMKRTMINRERLKFPSGIAAATLLQSLYSNSADAVRKARALMYAALVSGLTPLLMDLKVRGGESFLPSTSPVFDYVPGHLFRKPGSPFAPSDWTVVLDHKLLMVAGGMFIGLRICISTLLGAIALAFFIGPAALAKGAVHSPSQAWFEIGVWIGAPMLMSSSVASFALQWRATLRAFRGLAGAVHTSQGEGEVPPSWFVAGTIVAGVALVWMGHSYFQIPWAFAVVSVLLTSVLSVVACRVTGESDITPAGPMGSLMQFTYGALMPQKPDGNLLTASITAGATAASADLLTDLKSGHLLGASPRRQFVAQFLGIFAGTAATVIAYYLLVPDATAITGIGGKPPAFPAPGAQGFLAVARVFERGLASLSPMARQGLVWGVVIGAILAVVEMLSPKLRKWLPSPIGLGLGLIMPFQYPLSFFLGALIAWLWQRRYAGSAERYLVPVSSGVIAGESIVGVVVTAINNFVIGR